MRWGGMSKPYALLPFLFAISMLSCAKRDPVDEDVVSPPQELAGDLSATGLVTPANAATPEAVRQAALPAATGGLVWTSKEQEREAAFGPPGNPAFSIQCQKQREGQSQLVIIRHWPPTTGKQATLSFTGNGQVASVPVTAVANPNGIGGHWRAAVPPNEHARDVAETFSGPGTVEVSVSGTPPLIVATGTEPNRIFAECLAD
jgi:hypothetical protein